MKLHIIHLPERVDRWVLLQKELISQEINSYRVWKGIIDQNMICRGISKAHKQIVQFAKENQLKEVLIAEDDLRFTSSGAFQFFLNNKPEEYDIYLSSIYHGILKDDNTVNDFSGLTFYFIHEKFYDTFLSIGEEKNLDRALRNKGKFVVCNPFAVIQFNGFSDNKKKYCNYDIYLKDRILFDKQLV